MLRLDEVQQQIRKYKANEYRDTGMTIAQIVDAASELEDGCGMNACIRIYMEDRPNLKGDRELERECHHYAFLADYLFAFGRAT